MKAGEELGKRKRMGWGDFLVYSRVLSLLYLVFSVSLHFQRKRGSEMYHIIIPLSQASYGILKTFYPALISKLIASRKSRLGGIDGTL
jgi:hypothetical protein